MPKGISQEDELFIERFKVEVEQLLPFSLKVHKNYKLFLVLIYDKTNEYISESTLRRIFQYKNGIMPTILTLDIICRTVGYKDWSDFVEKVCLTAEEEQFEILSNLRYFGYNTHDEFYTIYNQFVGSKYLYDVVLALMQSALKKGDVAILEGFFDLKEIFNSKLPEQRSMSHLYLMHNVGMEFRNYPEVIRKLIPVYASNPISQQNFIERFVDEEYLNGYWGELLEEYHKNKKNLEAQLFYHCMMCQRDFLNGDFESEHLPFLIQFEETEPVSVIPKIRRLALLVVHYSKTNQPQKVEEMLQLIPGSLRPDLENCNTYSVLKFCQIVYVLHDAYAMKRYFAYYEQASENIYHHIRAKRNLNVLKIYQAFVAASDGDIAQAQTILDSYNPLYMLPTNHSVTEAHLRSVQRYIAREAEKQKKHT